MASKMYHDKISWSFNGFTSEEAAQRWLDDALFWFKQSFPDWKDWSIASSVSQTHQGYRASVEAEKDA